jgi:formyltetrahydrofolate-dependent phosphoribosylglycinamide formyltransferase
MTVRIAALCSGGGSNLQAILDHFAALEDRRAGDVVLIASDRADAGALERGRSHGIPSLVLDVTARTGGLLPLLREQRIDMLVLAGYLRFVPNDVTAAFRGKSVNVHPALLPAFGGPGMYGMRVHEAVVAAGVRVTGATVHFVDEHFDHGTIIAQWPVPVLAGDTPESVARRVLAVEHLIFPRAVQAVAAGDIALDRDGRLRGNASHHLPAHFALRDDPGAAAEIFDAQWRSVGATDPKR